MSLDLHGLASARGAPSGQARAITRPGTNWRPSACGADVIATGAVVARMPGAGQRNTGVSHGREVGVDVSMHARRDLCDALPPSGPNAQAHSTEVGATVSRAFLPGWLIGLMAQR
jgi:hypothetical protein